MLVQADNESKIDSAKLSVKNERACRLSPSCRSSGMSVSAWPLYVPQEPDRNVQEFFKSRGIRKITSGTEIEKKCKREKHEKHGREVVSAQKS